MTTLLLLLIVAVWALLPNRYAAAGLPAFCVLQRLLIDGDLSLFAVGPLHFQAVDALLLLLLAKCIFALAMEKELAVHGPLYFAIGLYLGVNLLATLAAVARFTDAPALGSVTPWIRLVSDILIVPITAQAVRTLPADPASRGESGGSIAPGAMSARPAR